MIIRDLLHSFKLAYLAIISINLVNSQIYTYNLKDLVKKNLLYVINLLINRQIYAQNLTRFDKKEIAILMQYKYKIYLIIS